MDIEKYNEAQNKIYFVCSLVKDIALDDFVNEIQKAQTSMKIEKDPVIYKLEFEKKQLIEEVAVRMRNLQRSAKLLDDFLLREKGTANGESSNHD